jgi:hypothetical protein
LLERHVTGRAEHLDALVAVTAGRRRGNAEVDQAYCAFLVEQHVTRRDVAMNDAAPAVRVVERAANLDAHVRALGGVEWACLEQNLGQREPLAQLHRDVIDAELDPQLVNGNDVGVAQLDGDFRLFHETAHEGVVERKLGTNLFDHEALLEADGAA